MKVTVCQLGNDPAQFANDWSNLIEHLRVEASDLIVLPEMPFSPWLAWTREFDKSAWQAAVDTHEESFRSLAQLAPATVISTRPVNEAGKRMNEGFVWNSDLGYGAVHSKYYLPNEDGFWEATWYDRGARNFEVIERRLVNIGFLICTEMWFTEHARAYAKPGAHILASPRATLKSTGDKWLAGGRAAAVMSGAYCLSSNRGGMDRRGMDWGGSGWIIEPEEGEVLALTSERERFVTVDIDLNVAVNAKKTYPRYVLE